MYIVIVSLIILVAVLLTLVVLVQESKGGGLASNFSGGASQILGHQKTGDVVEKATWVLAVALIVLCLSTSMIGGSSEVDDNTSKTEEFINE